MLNTDKPCPENNPEVMTSLIHELGMSPTVAFHDVYSLDDDSLLAFVPRPAYALLLVFPVNAAYESNRITEDSSRPVYSGSGPGEEVLWYKQTIANACGLIGLLHAASNGPVTEFIGEGSALQGLIQQAVPLKPEDRAELLYQSQALEAAHAGAASMGDTAAPAAEDEVETHYVCFVKSREGNLWELDGRRKGPINRGTLGPDEDVLSEKGRDLGPRAFLKREQSAEGGGDLRFSIIALGMALD